MTTFGSLQDVVGAALQRYVIELLTAKINDLQRREAAYQQRYGLDYPTFVQRTAEDEDFVQELAPLTHAKQSDIIRALHV